MTVEPIKQEQDDLTIAYMSGFYDGKKKREWVGLTAGEVAFLVPYCENKWDLEDYKAFAKDIEAKLKEKNT